MNFNSKMSRCIQHYNNTENNSDCSLCKFTQNDSLQSIKNDLGIVMDCKPNLDNKTFYNLISHLKQRTDLINEKWNELCSYDITKNDSEDREMFLMKYSS